MNELLRKIYDTVICYEKEAVKMGWEIDKEINTLIEPYKEKLTEEEKEELKNLLYGVSFTAEREGFMLGVTYTLKLLLSLLSD